MAAVAVTDPPSVTGQDRPPERAPGTGPVRTHASAAAEVPLLVLCDAVAGAGARELGELLGRFARRALDGHLMLLAGPPAGCGSAPLAHACRRIADGLPVPGPLYRVAACDRDGRELRVIDGADDADAVSPAGLSALLALARVPGTHALVIAAGPVSTPSVAAGASRRAWVLPADPARIDDVRATLTRAPASARRELLVACRAGVAAPGALRTLRALAAERRAPLVLLPSLEDSGRNPAAALRAAQVGLQALCGLVGR